MRVPTTRKLCTLTSYFRAHLNRKPKIEVPISKTVSSPKPQHGSSSDFQLSTLNLNNASPPEDSPDTEAATTQPASILHSSSVKGLVSEDSSDTEEAATTQLASILFSSSVKGLVSEENGKEEGKRFLDIPWFPDLSDGDISLKRKEASRERKQKWIFKYTSEDRFDRLVNMCAKKLGTKAAVDLFGHLGRETGLKEYNILIQLCIKKARTTDDENIAIEEMCKAFQLLKLIREYGFPIGEQTYRPLLQYLIDMGMVQEFQLFSDVIKAEDTSSTSRLGYYEMMLWLRVNHEEMIRDICEYITVEDSEDTTALRESYLLALCESDRKTQILDVLKNINITKLTSVESISNIFQALGRLQLESDAENLLLDLRASDQDPDDISNFIASYAVSIQNLAAEEIVVKIENLHEVLDVLPSFSSYEKLIQYCCGLQKVDTAIDIVDKMCEAGFKLSTQVLQYILQICEETYDYILVHRIYSIICRHNLKLNAEICRSLVYFCVRLKDFRGAYKMIEDLQKMNFMATAPMYNAIMAGYFREKNISGGLSVLKKMRDANVEPDSQTFSYLITNCESEEDIIKYYEELKQSGKQATKQIYMALINSYAACGEFEKAKQVLLDPEIPLKYLNEIKSVLVSALASNKQLPEALLIYKEIKIDGLTLEPKAIISLIEELTQLSGELDGLLLLLKQLSDLNLDYWADGCFRVIKYCVQNNHLSSAIVLFKQLKDRFESDDIQLEVLFDSVFSLIAAHESTRLQFGLDLLWAIKDEIGLIPSRQSLDFLLSACANAGDLNNARLIWREYEVAGFPYNVLSYLRMYQALLASGDHRSANHMLEKIPKDDLEVCSVILACQNTYSANDNHNSVEEKKKRKGKKKKKMCSVKR